MAKSSNLPAKIYSAGERTATRIRLITDFDGYSGDDNNHYVYVDLAQCLSAMNHRAYRQGLYYYVASVRVTCGTASTNRTVFSTAPDTWMTRNAWLRGFRFWMNQQREVLRATGNIQAKYADFKIALDDDHVSLHTSSTQDHGTDSSIGDEDNPMIQPTNNLMPYSYDKLTLDHAEYAAGSGIPTHLNGGEWAVSQFVAPDYGDPGGANEDPDSFMAHVIGQHEGSNLDDSNQTITSVGLIRSYARTRPQPNSEPDAWATDETELDPLLSIIDVGDTLEDVVKDMEDFNDEPPYDVDAPWGFADDQLYQVGQALTHGDGGVGASTTISGFCVPFGLLRIDSSSNDAVEIEIEMVPGTYHGVYAERVH